MTPVDVGALAAFARANARAVLRFGEAAVFASRLAAACKELRTRPELRCAVDATEGVIFSWRAATGGQAYVRLRNLIARVSFGDCHVPACDLLEVRERLYDVHGLPREYAKGEPTGRLDVRDVRGTPFGIALIVGRDERYTRTALAESAWGGDA